MDTHFAGNSMPNAVTVYWIPNTEASMQLREFLVKHGVKYTAYDVTTNAAYAVELLKRTGQDTAPLIITGDRHWTGWNKEIQSSLQSALKV